MDGGVKWADKALAAGVIDADWHERYLGQIDADRVPLVPIPPGPLHAVIPQALSGHLAPLARSDRAAALAEIRAGARGGTHVGQTSAFWTSQRDGIRITTWEATTVRWRTTWRAVLDLTDAALTPALRSHYLHAHATYITRNGEIWTTERALGFAGHTPVTADEHAELAHLHRALDLAERAVWANLPTTPAEPEQLDLLALI